MTMMMIGEDDHDDDNDDDENDNDEKMRSWHSSKTRKSPNVGNAKTTKCWIF